LTDRVVSLEAMSTTEFPGGVPDSVGRRFVRLNVLQPPEAMVAALVRLAPDLLTGLPSALLETARVFGAEGTRLGVRAIFTGGELLQSGTRHALERAYGARVFDVYGTSETKEIAWECRLGGMHVNADVVHVEIVDGAGQSLPAGHEGEIVTTLLVNHAMPLLRYRTGDWGSLLAEPCACGRAAPLLGVVTGRETETLAFAGGCRMSPYALTCVLEQVPGLARYQVLQLGPTAVTVRAIVDGGADQPAVAREVQAALHAAVAPLRDVRVEFVERLATGPRAKFRVVQRMEVV
jgi:phenylacetate-CoA ligase